MTYYAYDANVHFSAKANNIRHRDDDDGNGGAGMLGRSGVENRGLSPLLELLPVIIKMFHDRIDKFPVLQCMRRCLYLLIYFYMH